jgi:hypothetical protein
MMNPSAIVAFPNLLIVDNPFQCDTRCIRLARAEMPDAIRVQLHFCKNKSTLFQAVYIINLCNWLSFYRLAGIAPQSFAHFAYKYSLL